MDRGTVTVRSRVALSDGAVGVVTRIAGDDDAQALQAGGPVSVRLLDGGQLVHVTYEQIADVLDTSPDRD